MAWQVRGRCRYYTRTHKVQGRYRREYVGGGTVGELAAAADALRRANRQAALVARRAEHARLMEAGRPLIELDRLCSLLASAALAAGGYHKHGGEWRRAMTPNTQPDKAANPAPEKRLDDQQVKYIVAAAMRGERAALPDLARVLDERPELWRMSGDLAAQAQQSWLTLAAGKDLFFQESLRRQAAQLRTDLAGPEASPLEQLLVERVVACWIQVSYSDAAYAQMRGATFAQDAAAQKKQNAAQTRYLQAIKQLAIVRKLLKPAPSPLDLLKFPINEGDAGTRRCSRRAGPAAEPVAN
jgi:hypothetical protein